MDIGWINKWRKEETPEMKSLGLFIESRMEAQDKIRGGAGKGLTNANREKWYGLQKEINNLERRYKTMWEEYDPIYHKKYKEWVKEIEECRKIKNATGKGKYTLTPTEYERIKNILEKETA